MNKPLSVIGLNAATPMPERHKATVTLSFSVESYDGPPIPNFGKQLQDEISYWSDGRYPLMVEMLQHALSEICRKAINDAIDGPFRKMYGHEMIEYGPNCTINRAVIEAKAAPRPRVSVSDELTATVEVIE